jgi:H+/Cl- antiporter ClcA
MSMRTHGQLKHKFTPVKMRLPVAHSARRHLTPRTPQGLHSPPVMRDVPTDKPDALTPIMIVGICLAGAAIAALALLVLVHWYRKRARAARTMQRGIKTARASVNGHAQPEMAQAWRQSVGGNASDDTHVVDVVYGDKVKSSFESS